MKFKKVVALLLFINFITVGIVAKNKNNTIFLSKEKFDEDSLFSLGYRASLGNKYHINSYYSTEINYSNDTVYLKNYEEINSLIKMSDSSYYEFWFKVFVDTSMAYKNVAIDLISRYPSLIFWDKKIIAQTGNLNVLNNTSNNERIVSFAFPLFTGKTGYHNLIIKKYRSLNRAKTKFVVYPPSLILHKNYNHYLKKTKEKEYATFQLFVVEGLRFFILCVFTISLLFYLIVKRNKTFFWFSVFCFCILLCSFFNFFAARFEIGEEVLTISLMSLICLSVFSFLSFLFIHFTNRIPKRIYYYSSIVPLSFIVTLILLL
jgi:hypothetical protein